MNAALVDVCRREILRAATDCGVAVLAYCFMPDHAHLLVHLPAAAPISNFVKRAKQLSGFHGKQLTGSTIWQTGYYERTLRESEETRNVVAYILQNPVRAGLVERPEDYPFSGGRYATTTTTRGR